MLDSITRYKNHGLFCVPAIKNEKRPNQAWRNKQQHDIDYSGEFDAVAIICGKASDNIEVLDFDDCGSAFDTWLKLTDASDQCCQRTPSGGYHVIYRCDVIEGNQKLAMTGGGKTLIETRGEGGLIIASPTEGYEWINDESAIKKISPDERNNFLDVARSLNKFVEPLPVDKSEWQPVSHPGGRAGDEFNNRGEIETILIKYGWSKTRGGHNSYWRRPGKDSGISATYKDGVFYVFSSNAYPFEPNKGYSRFSVYGLLEFGGDYTAAADSLYCDGYGNDNVQSFDDIDISAIMDFGKPKKVYKREPIPDDLLNPGGFLQYVIDYNNSTAHKPQPILALAGAIALQAVLCSRKIKDEYGTRPNIYIASVAHSGAGKDHARQVNKNILFESNQLELQAEGLKSGSALINALAVQPAILFQLDEYGRFIKTTKNAMQSPHKYEIIDKFLQLYSSSNSVFESDRYAEGEKGGKQIDYPHASIYGTTVPCSLYGSMTEESVTDGFLSRTLIFSSLDKPRRRLIKEIPVPKEIIGRAEYWKSFNPGGGMLDCDPVVYEHTPEAIEYIESFVDREFEEENKLGENPISVLWSRCAQNANKLALIHAASLFRGEVIGIDSVKWGYRLAMFLLNSLIYDVKENVAENPFHGMCLKAQKYMRDSGGEITHSKLLKRMKVDAITMKKIISTMEENGSISVERNGRLSRYILK